jgi:hypothetical protein
MADGALLGLRGNTFCLAGSKGTTSEFLIVYRLDDSVTAHISVGTGGDCPLVDKEAFGPGISET